MKMIYAKADSFILNCLKHYLVMEAPEKFLTVTNISIITEVDDYTIIVLL